MTAAFISYSSLDRHFARKIASRLSIEGISVWFDEFQLQVGDTLIDRIAEAISHTDCLIAIISSNSVQSEWAKKELSLAMSKEIAGKRIVVLPVKIDNCALPASLADKKYADFSCSEEFEAQLGQLLDAIRVNRIERTVPCSAQRPNNATTNPAIEKVFKIAIADFNSWHFRILHWYEKEGPIAMPVGEENFIWTRLMRDLPGLQGNDDLLAFVLNDLIARRFITEPTFSGLKGGITSLGRGFLDYIDGAVSTSASAPGQA